MIKDLCSHCSQCRTPDKSLDINVPYFLNCVVNDLIWQTLMPPCRRGTKEEGKKITESDLGAGKQKKITVTAENGGKVCFELCSLSYAFFVISMDVVFFVFLQ